MTSNPSDPRIGTVLADKYRLDARIGRGGMGTIYKGLHVMLSKPVAVKLINPDLVTSPEMAGRFQREARAASQLDHPNIATVHDLGQTEDGTLYIAMEFIEGVSLKDLIRQEGQLPSDRIVAFLRQIAGALQAAHRRGIVHRDLKPQNIMVTTGSDGREAAKLLDFGIAKMFDEEATQLTATGLSIGTPQYMSPEQANGAAVDGRSDLYSLGIILYEMLIGTVPFDDKSTPAVLIKHVTQPPPRPSLRRPDLKVPAGLEAVALRCLEKNPAARFQTAEEFIGALEGAGRSTAPADDAAATVVLGAAVAAATVVPARDHQPPGSVPSSAQEPPAPPPASNPLPAGPAAALAREPDAGALPGGAVLPPRSHLQNLTSVPPPLRGASSEDTGTRRSVAGNSLILAVLTLVLVGGVGFAGYFLGYFSGPSETGATTEAAVDPASIAAAAGGAGAADPSGAGAASGTPAGETTGQVAAGGTPAGAGGAPPATKPAAARPTGAASPAPAPASAPPPVPAQAPAQPEATLPEHPSVRFGCDGPPEACVALQAQVDQALGRASMPSVIDEARAELLVDALVIAGARRVDRMFETTFVIQPYTVTFSGAARRSGERLPMPDPVSFSLDERVGQARLTEQARLISSAVVQRLQAYWASKR